MALAVGVVGQPAPRARVEVQPLGLLAAVAAALPRVHRPLVAGRPGRLAGLGQPPVAVAEQRPGQLGEAQVQEREDEQLVPEDVAPVGLAVQAPGRHAGVEVDGVRGHGLEQVEHVQVEDAGRPPGRRRRPGRCGSAATAGPRPGRGAPAARRTRRGSRATRPRAASPGSAMARSREVYSATTFSTVTGSPSRTSTVRSWATKPGSVAVRRPAATAWPSRTTRVRGRQGDPQTGTASSPPAARPSSSPASPSSTGARWRPSSAR